MVNYFRITIILLVLFCIGCAQMVAPTGGEKDIDSPIVLKMEPLNNSIHFNQSKIKIEFNEFVKLRDIDKQLIVSPPLKNKLKTKIKGKTLEIELQDTLYEKHHICFEFWKCYC